MCPFLLSSHMAGGRFELFVPSFAVSHCLLHQKQHLQEAAETNLSALFLPADGALPGSVPSEHDPYNKGHGAKAPCIDQNASGTDNGSFLPAIRKR